jgi:predicted secreted hydrolase
VTAERPTRRAVLGALALAAPALAARPLRAQGFANMGSEAAGFARVVPGRAFAFPADHLPHPGYRIEWWYVTATLTAEDGAECGCQWTLFRQATDASAPEAGWDSNEIWMGHAAVTTAATHRAAERFGRGGVGQAGVTDEGGFAAWIDDWSFRAEGDPADPLARARLTAGGPDFGFDLALAAEGPLVLHGDGGFSLKSERGQASYYYSQPFFRAGGALTIDGAERRVAGTAWMDREWSSQPLDPDQTGWDWFSLSLGSGERAMLYRFRQTRGDAFAGTWIGADGAVETLPRAGVRMTPIGQARTRGGRIPVRWRLEIPAKGFDVETRPLNPDSWNALTIPYWEGPVSFQGSHAGRGYLEMTGYDA